MAAEPVLTATVLTYDGRELLEVVLPSLAAQTFTDFRTVVVDNGSSDGSAAWLAVHWPQVEVVSLPANVGVTAALNVCLDAATTELVALLNNDVELHPDCLGELVAAMREHPAPARPRRSSSTTTTAPSSTVRGTSSSGTAWRRGAGTASATTGSTTSRGRSSARAARLPSTAPRR